MTANGMGAWLKERLARFLPNARQVNLKLGIGIGILLFASALYLGQYAWDAMSCVGDAAPAAFTDDPVDWQCFGDVIKDLRKDNTAATVILAIAAAILASAWSSGSDADADAGTDADAVA